MQARDALANSQETLGAFLESFPFGAFILDRGGTILAVNPQQERNSGVQREQVVGRKLEEAFAGVMDRYGLREPLRRLLETGEPLRVHIERYEPQHIKKRMRFRAWGFRFAGGERVAVLTEGTGEVRAELSPEIVGASESMAAVYRFIERAAQVTTTVLLGGESGTGKELAARAIHSRSERASKPFLALNCAALPGPLLESTLFGNERGAFTGAERRTKGYFEAAEGGSLLLDEIGETALEFQAKLLRVLQDGVVTRLGGTEPLRTNVRVICATNRDLEEEVRARRFREDLYYRINVLRLDLPPLRERPDDIPLLTKHFLDELEAKHHLGTKHVTPRVLDAFLGYRWPGNVRELASVLEAAYVTSPDAELGLEVFPNRVRESALLHPVGHYEPHAYRDALERFRKDYVAQVLACAGGDIRRASRMAGVNPSTLYRLGGRAGKPEDDGAKS
jgi:PAS domain S-box-containing protein